jgi:Icc-related predicted phosphoesterase
MEKLTIDLLSDTHNQHAKFQCDGGNILIHAGDVSLRGSEVEIITFLDWYAKQDYDHLVLVPGNHDFGFERTPALFAEECQKRNIILLNDSGVDLEGIKIWGSAVQPWFHNWAFNRDRGPEIKHHWDMIPDDTELLITHGPPAGFLDVVSYVDGTPKERAGCQDLMDKILKTQVKLHVFGHIHEARGIEYLGPTTFVNASCLDRMYSPASKRPIRVTREIVQDGSICYLAEE